jgi:hypothetical protein
MHRVTPLIPLALALLLAACSARPAPICEPPADVRVFQAADIGEQWIDYMWVEIPARASEGIQPGRLFVASADPVGAIVPTMIELPCADGPVDYTPATVDLEFGTQGNFKTSYGWKSCAACSECYMQWTFSLDVEGHVEEDVLRAELVLNETFHSGPMKLVTLDMAEVTQACEEPRMRCESPGACEEIRFEGRN